MNLKNEIGKLIGDNKVFDSLEHRETYARDESTIKETYLPDVVVHPESTEDVAKVVKFAYENEIPVVPRGAGTGLSGGALAIHGGIMLSFDRMKQIVELDEGNLHVTLQPGVITGELHKEVEKHGLFYPPDPASLDDCSMGGNIAENAGGPRAFKYGVTKNYVLELEVVIGNGEVLRVGRRTKKWVVGYNMPQVFVGSEGTLGIVTEITVALIPKPPQIQTLLIAFPDEYSAGKTVSEIVKAQILPVTLEFMDRKSFDYVKDKAQNIPEETGALLLVEVDGWSESEVIEQTEKIAEICEQQNVIEIFAAFSDQDRERLWHARRILYTTLEENSQRVRSEDIVVKRELIPEVVTYVRKLEEKVGLPLPTFGHAGDGNLHVNFLYNDEEIEKVKKGVKELYEYILSIGGTISGEHGIGLLKKPYINMEQPANLIALQKNLKNVFDPKGILNPGKIF